MSKFMIDWYRIHISSDFDKAANELDDKELIQLLVHFKMIIERDLYRLGEEYPEAVRRAEARLAHYDELAKGIKW